MINPARLSALETDTLRAGHERYRQMERLHEEGRLDAVRLQSLIGSQYKVDHKVYVITDVHYGYDGRVRGKGRRVLANGKLGTQRWDVGSLLIDRF